MKTQQQLSVFLVDDDKVFLKTLEHYLQYRSKHDVTIRSFPTGEECLKYLHEKPDIIVVDYILNSNYPDAMNGAEVLQKIKRVSPDMTVIVISGQEKMEIALNTFRDGAYDYVLKSGTTLLQIQNVLSKAIESVDQRKRRSARASQVRVAAAIAGVVVLALVVVRRMFLM